MSKTSDNGLQFFLVFIAITDFKLKAAAPTCKCMHCNLKRSIKEVNLESKKLPERLATHKMNIQVLFRNLGNSIS